MFQEYKNESGNSNIREFEIGSCYISVRFDNSDDIYVYSNRKPGKYYVDIMKDKALQGCGLSSYINTVIYKRYHTRLSVDNYKHEMSDLINYINTYDEKCDPLLCRKGIEFYRQHKEKPLSREEREECVSLMTSIRESLMASLASYDARIADEFNGVNNPFVNDCEREILVNKFNSMHISYHQDPVAHNVLSDLGSLLRQF